MSNFSRSAYHPPTGTVKSANYMDDYFGRHQYGVSFPGDPQVYHPAAVEIPQDHVYGPCSPGEVTAPPQYQVENQHLREKVEKLEAYLRVRGDPHMNLEWFGQYQRVNNWLNSQLNDFVTSRGTPYDNTIEKIKALIRRKCGEFKSSAVDSRTDQTL